jgi:hypothetical protein
MDLFETLQGKFPSVNTKEDGFLWAAPVDAFPPQNPFGMQMELSANVADFFISFLLLLL